MLKNAPHTAQSVLGDKWEHPYSRESVRCDGLKVPCMDRVL